MGTTLLSPGLALLLLGGVPVCLRPGWRIGRRRLRIAGEDWQAGPGALEGAVFGRMGLLIAFTFTGAIARLEARRNLITRQVSAIGAAWLRLDLPGAADRDQVREGFRRGVGTPMETETSIRSCARPS